MPTDAAARSEYGSGQAPPAGPLDAAQIRAGVRATKEGQGFLALSVPGIRCGGCVAGIERMLGARDDVVSARVNLTFKRANIIFPIPETDPVPIVGALAAMGFPATLADNDVVDGAAADATGGQLLRAMAVAGFGAANIMLLSVGVWSGAEGTMRDGFHLVSALIGVPVVAYAGQPFFRSAFDALRAGRTNMDVPISVGVILALMLSLFETLTGGAHVFFDAAVTLLFFLLCGRYLDHLMRARARSAIDGLARLSPRGAMVRNGAGGVTYVPLASVIPGNVLCIAAGERVPVDALVLSGDTDLDRSLITGEAMPVVAGRGDTLESGTLNLTGAIEAEALRSADESFLAQMMRMQATAEGGRGRYTRIADRAARLYSPVVHTLALATFAGWLVATGGDWRSSAFVAISVLIITCPCALGLAVPVAHVVAAGRLMRMGILMKDGSALERMAQIDRAVFDKTGTLTTGTPRLGQVAGDPAERSAARALARVSRHPAARAIADAVDEPAATVADASEVPGFGVEGRIDGRIARLGRVDWLAEITTVPSGTDSPAFAFTGGTVLSFDLHETLRPGARAAIDDLVASGIECAMLSGDGVERAARVADAVGITQVRHGATPAEKIAYLDVLRAEGHHVLMVGDGLNDAAALASAYVSMAPASASDAGRSAADFVILRDGLEAVPATLDCARATARIVRQNFALAIAYNGLAIPLAMAGLVTPLIAALAMSGSSVLVIANALRLNRTARPKRPRPVMAQPSAVPA